MFLGQLANLMALFIVVNWQIGADAALGDCGLPTTITAISSFRWPIKFIFNQCAVCRGIFLPSLSFSRDKALRQKHPLLKWVGRRTVLGGRLHL